MQLEMYEVQRAYDLKRKQITFSAVPYLSRLFQERAAEVSLVDLCSILMRMPHRQSRFYHRHGFGNPLQTNSLNYGK